MSKETQIEEMAKTIDSEYDCVIPCKECPYYNYMNCRDVKSAEKLYNAGYRKQSEVVREFAEEVKLEFYREFDEIIPSIMADKIDDLVKKYTEDEK